MISAKVLTQHRQLYCTANMANPLYICLLLMSFLFPNPALADDRAIELIDEMEALYQGQSSSAVMTMIVETPQYQREMEMEASSIGTEKSFIRILSPRKDRGISTLKLDMEMWNFLP